MEATNIESFLDLGLTGLLLVAVIVLARYLKEIINKKDEVIKSKDDLMEKNRTEVLQVIRENTKTQEQLRATLQEQIKATDTLAQKVYEALKN